jgi:hypothetical protein
MSLPQSDQYVEGVYNLVNAQASEQARLEVARAAALAAQHRAAQIARKSTAPAQQLAEGKQNGH